MDQELREVVQEAELDKRFLDKLVRVSAKTGEENWIYIHLAIQASRQDDHAKWKPTN